MGTPCVPDGCRVAERGHCQPLSPRSELEVTPPAPILLLPTASSPGMSCTWPEDSWLWQQGPSPSLWNVPAPGNGDPSQSPGFLSGSAALSLPVTPMMGSLHEGFLAGGCGVVQIRMGYRGVLHEFWGAGCYRVSLSFPRCSLFPDFRFNPLPGAVGSFSAGLDALKMGNEGSLGGKCMGSVWGTPSTPPLLQQGSEICRPTPSWGRRSKGNQDITPGQCPAPFWCRPRPCPRSAGRSRRSLMALDGFFFQEFAAGWF